jgi:hypothetical protein
MQKLFAKCPATEHVIETGVLGDEVTIASIGDTKVTVFCEHCGSHHIMKVVSTYC